METQRRSPPALALALAEDDAGDRSHEETFTWINFILLLAVLVYILRKPVSGFFAQRSREVRDSLEAGRKALEESQARLAGVEAKLAHLEDEIAAFRAAAASEMEAERARLLESTEREAARILDSARHQIEAATRSAKLDLKVYAAEQTVRLAEQIIRQRLDDAAREKLVSRFVAGLRTGQESQREN